MGVREPTPAPPGPKPIPSPPPPPKNVWSGSRKPVDVIDEITADHASGTDVVHGSTGPPKIPRVIHCPYDGSIMVKRGGWFRPVRWECPSHICCRTLSEPQVRARMRNPEPMEPQVMREGHFSSVDKYGLIAIAAIMIVGISGTIGITLITIFG